MYPGVVKVKAHPDFTLDIEFDNGEEGTLEMAPFLEQKAFGKIKDYEYFKRVKVSFDAIEWECGIDLDPEFTYAECRKKAKA